MKYKYRTSSGLIYRVPIVRETEKSVYRKTLSDEVYREAKTSVWHSYFDTFEEARSGLLADQEYKIRNSQRRIDWAKNEMQRLREIKKSDVLTTES